MAKIADEITVKVTAEPSEALKQLIRSELVKLLQEPEVLNTLEQAISKRLDKAMRMSGTFGTRGG